MSEAGQALLVTLLGIVWPGLLLVSFYALHTAIRFNRGLKRSMPGTLVLVTVVGWVSSLVGVALVSTFYLLQDPEGALPVVLPVFVLWAGSMTTIVWVMQRWGKEAVTLETYYRELEQMDRMKSQFINNVAHELNTPITPLKIQLDLLCSGNLGDLTERQRSSLASVSRNVDRLAVLVQQVLLASMVQSGRLSMHPESVDLRLLMEAAVVTAREAAGGASAPVDVSGEPGLEAWCDPERIRYVAEQVLSRTIQDAQGQPVDVMVRDRGGNLVVRVHNPARGAPDAERSFKPFAGAPMDPGSLPEQGLGLEMFISRGIVERHGGRMWIESPGDGQGSVIAFSLPKDEATAHEARLADAHLQPTAPRT